MAGLPAVRLVSSDYCVMARHTAQIMAGGPALVERALGRAVTKDELGGAALHEKSGVIDDVVEDEAAAFGAIRRFLGYLPQNVWELPPVQTPSDDPERPEDALSDIVPVNRRRIYDMRRILAAVLDRDTVFEMGRRYAPGIITVLARLNGVPVGVFANDCRHAAGTMRAEGARKMRRFVEFCETFHLPVITFVDEPGFMIGPELNAKARCALGGRGACGGPLDRAVGDRDRAEKHGTGRGGAFRPGRLRARLAVGRDGCVAGGGWVAVAFRREIAAADDPVATRAALEEKFAAGETPFARAEALSIHDIIDPRETRPRPGGAGLELACSLLGGLLGLDQFFISAVSCRSPVNR